MPSIISIKNLTKIFGAGAKKVHAVNGLSFDVEKGSITGLLGPNGAGKTTTIQMILDLITPTAGTISVFGMDMKHNREEILNDVNFSSPYVSLPGNLKVGSSGKALTRNSFARMSSINVWFKIK